MKKTFLVTGGVGFIGYHLCKNLLKKKNKSCLFRQYKQLLFTEIKKR